MKDCKTCGKEIAKEENLNEQPNNNNCLTPFIVCPRVNTNYQILHSARVNIGRKKAHNEKNFYSNLNNKTI